MERARIAVHNAIMRYRREARVSMEDAFLTIAVTDEVINRRRLWETFATYKSWAQRKMLFLHLLSLARQGDKATNSDENADMFIDPVLNGELEFPSLMEGGAAFHGKELVDDDLGMYVVDAQTLRNELRAEDSDHERDTARRMNGTPAGARITDKNGTDEGEREILEYLRHGRGGTDSGSEDAGA